MPSFDCYVFADYSGSENVKGQRKAIALAIYKRKNDELQVITGLTRESLRQTVVELLTSCHVNSQRAIFGFDHQYSFPSGLYKELTGQEWKSWNQVLELIGKGGLWSSPCKR